MIVHDGAVEVEPLEVVERCPCDGARHGRLELATEVPQLQLVMKK